MNNYICVLTVSLLCATHFISAVNPVSNDPFSEESAQSLSESVATIVHDLERGITVLDNLSQIALADGEAKNDLKTSLYIVDAAAKQLIVKLIGLLKIGKLNEAGLTDDELRNLAAIFNEFHTKLLAVLPR